MIISKQNTDNTELFNEVLKRYPNKLIVIITQEHKYLPNIEIENKIVIYLKEEMHSKEIKEKLSKYRVFFKDTLNPGKKAVKTTSSFSDKIMQNLLSHTDSAINDATKYASLVYNELDLENNIEFIVIAATKAYPDVMILLNPAIPESQEKTHIKEVLCYPNKV